jgi:thioredoxin-like negative regulator of GroEL
MKQVLYFHAPSCAPCAALKPMMQRLQGEMTIVSIDTDVSYQSAQTWNIRNVPTVLIVSNSREQGRLVGSAISESEIRRLYKQ